MASSSTRQIIRFIFKGLIIVSVILICDRGIGAILKLFYFNQESGPLYRTTYTIDSTVADILIFGSSQANHSYIPEIFESGLHCTCYNTGRDGNYILYNYAIFKAITERYNPKLVIFDVNSGTLNYSSTDYDRLSALLPYYQTHPEISSIVNLRGPFEKIKLFSTIYPYNSMIIHIVLGNLDFNKQRKPENKGYVPLNKTMKNAKLNTLQINDCTQDEIKIQALKDIISTCKQNNIDLVFIYSPRWFIIQDSFCNEVIPDLCSENGICYLNMSNDSTFINNPTYFADQTHLNDEGAQVFSTMLTEKLKLAE